MNSVQTSTNASPKYLGMAWYKFLTSVGFITGAVLSFLFSFVFLTGSIYLSQTNGEITAEQVYAYYGETLHAVDITYGLFLIGLAVLAIVLRHKLANFEPDAMKYVYVFYILSAGASLVYWLLTALITNQSFSDMASTELLMSLVIAFLQIIYFKRRSHLFVGKTETSDDLVQLASLSEDVHNPSVMAEASYQAPSHEIFFCRNCGTRLVDDSTFCHKCGTKVR